MAGHVTRNARGTVLGATCLAVTLTLVLSLTSALTAAAHGATAAGHRLTARDGHADLTVLTRNLDEGTDFEPVFTATTPAAFVLAATTTWQEVQASDIPGRADLVAREIAANEPDLVSLQESSVWSTGPALPATNVVFDALASLRNALAERHARYRVIAVVPEFSGGAPTALGYDVSFVDEDVLLARAGVHVSDVSTAHFANLLTIPSVAGPLTIERGWAAADVALHGRTVRFVATHLESFSPAVQAAQAAELLAGPAATGLPVVMAADFNTGPGSPAPFLPTYTGLLTTGGFTDTWTVTRPADTGYTWALHAEDPFASPTTPTKRIDLVLVRGAVEAVADWRVGTHLGRSGRWPSDHAGVVAVLDVR
jgi:endonuclease/exonuclease/phosphatase family metal-dependent hydrolase